MFDAKWDLKGAAAVVNKLAEIPAALRGKVGRQAAGRAMSVVRKAAKANAMALDDPLTGNKIAANIAQRPDSKYQRRTGDVKIRVGVLGGARNYEAYGELRTGKSAKENPGGDTFYWRFLEFGTELARARPFMRPALENNVEAVEAKFGAEVEKAIDRIVKKG